MSSRKAVRPLASRFKLLIGLFSILTMGSLLAMVMLIPNSGAFKSPESAEAFPEFKGMAKTILWVSEADQEGLNLLLEGVDRAPISARITIDYLGELDQYDALVNRRGATSFSFEKPQLAVSFVDDKGSQTERAVMDMPRSEDWILNGPFLDRSMMRNVIAYQAAFEVMGYAPRQQYTALYLKRDHMPEQYMGLYLWTEKIRKGKNRVSIQNSPPLSAETSFIAVKDAYRGGDTMIPVYGKELSMYSNEWLCLYPKATLTDGQLDFIGDVITRFERVLYHDRFQDPKDGYRQHVDEQSFIDYYIINEFFLNTDAGLKSTFIHRDIRGELVMGPVWDFNNAMGNVNSLLPKMEWRGLFMHERPWFDRLVQDKTFVQAMLLRYKVLRSSFLSTERLLAQIDSLSSLIQEEAKRDHLLYSSQTIDAAAQQFLLGMDQSLAQQLKAQSPDKWQFETEVANLKRFVEMRGNWLDGNFDSLMRWTD